MEMTAEPTNVGSQSQLFIDDYFVDGWHGIELFTNPPQKEGKALFPEKPWEAYRICASAVLQDGDNHRMYYNCISGLRPSQGGQIECEHCGRMVRDNTILCKCGWAPYEGAAADCENAAYAESTDGLHWERPNLGLREFRGITDTNIIPYGGVVAIDPHPKNGVRYLALFGAHSMMLVGSTDGVNFEPVARELTPFICDTANQILWDPNCEKYVAYLRGFPKRRTVVRTEMDDPRDTPWPHNEEADLSIEPDKDYITTQMPTVMDGEVLGTYEVYNPCVHIHPHRNGGVYLAFPSIYRAYPRLPNHPDHYYNQTSNDGMAEIWLLVSRDGKNFTIPHKTAYVRPGTEQEPDRGYLSMAVGMIEHGDELYQYYTGNETTHGVVTPDEASGVGGVYRLVQERDRFVGARAGYNGGEITTPPIVFSGECLEINVDCGGLGEAWVELLDHEGKPIAGFTMDEADVIDMNHIHARCSWMGRDDVSKLAGRAVRLHFRLRAATLYAFRFFT